MTQITSQSHTALVLVDIQDGFIGTQHWGPSRSNPAFEQNAASLLTKYRSLVSTSPTAQHKTIHVIHSSIHPSSPLHATSPGYAIQSFATPLPGEPVVVKNVNSGFIGTNLETLLREHFGGKPGKLWVVGLSTDHCVNTTVRMAGNLGVCDGVDGEKGEVVLIEDATAAWKKGVGSEWCEAELVHRVHVESLREFATIAETENVLEEWDGLLKI
jgi:nicotinamidase-related amidase